MSMNKKRRQQDSFKATNGKTEKSDDSDQEEPMEEEEIEVDFEARTMGVDDVNGVKCLLKQLFLQDDIAIGLTDLLLTQNYVGSVIKQSEIPEASEDDDDGDGDVFGVVSVVNLTEKKDVPCIKALRKFLLDKCQTAGNSTNSEILNKLLDNPDRHVGFVICERFINIPSRIAVPMYESLSSDMETANNRKLNFKFANYILMSKTYHPAPPVRQDSLGTILFANREEECLQDDSMLQFDFSVSDVTGLALGGNWDDGSDEFMPHRKISVFTADKFNNIVSKIKPLFEN